MVIFKERASIVSEAFFYSGAERRVPHQRRRE